MNLDDFPQEALTTEQENEIALTPKVSADRARLVMHNMREALLYAKKCSYGKLNDGELVSVVYLGLRDAASNFAPNKIRFFGYAKPYVRGRIFAEWRSLNVVKKGQVTGWQPTCDYDTANGAERNDETDEKPIRENGTDNYKPLVTESEDFNHDLTAFREEWQLIEPMVRTILSDKERMILELRYISGFNFRQIGDLFAKPVSRSHVQHLHGVALGKIQTEMVKAKLLSHCSEE